MDDIDKIKKRIEKENKKFENATVMEKRVLIARDVLNLLKKQKIKPEVNRYIDIKSDVVRAFRTTNPHTSLATFFKKEMKTCEACAVGSLFVAAVRRFNNVSVGAVDLTEADAYSNLSEQVKTFLKEYFDKITLSRIEAVFEGGTHWLNGHSGPGVVDPKLREMCPLVEAVKEANPPAERRMTWVMQTIIEQNGLFEPWKTKDYQDWLKEAAHDG